MTALAWEDTPFLKGQRAEVADNVLYYAVWWRYARLGEGYDALVIAHGPKGGMKYVSLGLCPTIAEAKRNCEQHYANGCDLSRSRY
jgi:hypothetical protein